MDSWIKLDRISGPSRAFEGMYQPVYKIKPDNTKYEKLIFHKIKIIDVECFKRYLLGENVWFSEEPRALKRA